MLPHEAVRTSTADSPRRLIEHEGKRQALERKLQVLIRAKDRIMLDTDSGAGGAAAQPKIHEKSEFVNGCLELSKCRRL
jgi:hypothetical protein